jgi:hypothetical protein
MGYIRTGIRLLHSCLNWIFILNWTQLRQQKREEVVKVRGRGAGSGEGRGVGRQESHGPPDFTNIDKKTDGGRDNLKPNYFKMQSSSSSYLLT